jgi:diguanylate cyclase (GGDEF)-like protein
MARILIAGNEASITKEAGIMLEASGYRLKTCDNLHDSLALVFEDPPDLMIVEKGFAAGEEVELIKAVKACLQKANIPILLIASDREKIFDIDWNRMSVDDLLLAPFDPAELLARIRLAESRMMRVFDNNPLSRLPGNTSILRAIERIIESEEDFALCYVDIDNFKPYNDRYGFTRGDEVILMVARIIVNVVDEMAREESFVGHVGGDDFVFIVKLQFCRQVCEKILANFQLVRNMFLSPEDIKEGAFVGKDRLDRETRFGLLSLSIAVVTSVKGKYKHYGEISSAASEVKHYVKQLEGSNYLIDRRES